MMATKNAPAVTMWVAAFPWLSIVRSFSVAVLFKECPEWDEAACKPLYFQRHYHRNPGSNGAIFEIDNSEDAVIPMIPF
jgi:hypothetical protein